MIRPEDVPHREKAKETGYGGALEKYKAEFWEKIRKRLAAGLDPGNSASVEVCDWLPSYRDFEFEIIKAALTSVIDDMKSCGWENVKYEDYSLYEMPTYLSFSRPLDK